MHDTHKGFIVGLAEFSSTDGSLVQRIADDTNTFGNTSDPTPGERGFFEVTVTSEELASKGVGPGNRIGIFIHRNNGDPLYDGSTTTTNDTYFIDNVFLDVSGSISMLEQWMTNNQVANPLSDSDGDGMDNRTEYFFGGNPTLADASEIRPHFRMVQDEEKDWIELVYRKRSNAQLGLEYSIESSATLTDWKHIGIVNQDTEVINGEINAVTSRVSMEEQPARFLRLQLMEP
ncbi:hypothetical protein [Pelagicoccus mobilis]|uniref:hypothetical protein n=1 Tax=Pelagicoccus mobilis TaxID=415221 RepID=UPI00366D7B7D